MALTISEACVGNNDLPQASYFAPNNPTRRVLRDNNDKNQWDLLNVSLLNIVVLLSPKSTFHVCRAINFYAIVCFCCSPTVIRWNQLHVFNVGESALKSPIRLHSNRLIRRTSTFWTYPTANLASIFQRQGYFDRRRRHCQHRWHRRRHRHRHRFQMIVTMFCTGFSEMFIFCSGWEGRRIKRFGIKNNDEESTWATIAHKSIIGQWFSWPTIGANGRFAKACTCSKNSCQPYLSIKSLFPTQASLIVKATDVWISSQHVCHHYGAIFHTPLRLLSIFSRCTSSYLH